METASKKLYNYAYFIWHKKRWPELPDNRRYVPKYTDKTANGLTAMVIDFLEYTGNYGERINTGGRPVDKTRVVTDCIGGKKRIGNIEWIRSGSTNGSADISATIRGRSVKIEVKIGKDRQSEAQKKYEAKTISSGGVYLIIKNFDDFIRFYIRF